MIKCQICNIEPQTSQLTRCCKLFICDTCRQKHEKSAVCVCGKSVNKKLCANNEQLFDIIKNYYEGRPDECERCQNAAQIQCLDCNMLFCNTCNSQIHDAKGFAKHIREFHQKQKKSYKKIYEKAIKKDQFCKDHKVVCEFACDCGVFLCVNCVKSHKQICSKMVKLKTIKDYREQYFSQILFKIKQISQYKQKLQSDKVQYTKHFSEQQQIYITYVKLIEQQFQGLKKMFEMKIVQTKAKLNDYWKECQNSYNKTQYLVDFNLKKYDDYARLSEMFVEQTIGYDYLQKRVKKTNINEQFFNFKIQGIEELQCSIMNITSIFKIWDTNSQQKITNCFDQSKKQQPSSAPISATSQLLLQCSSNPLLPRPITLKSTHNQVLFQFLHLPYQTSTYEIEYGVGLKMKGQEIFKKIQNRNGAGFISNLNPSTKYRVRMRVAAGEWGNINQIKTQQNQKFVAETCAISKHTQDVPHQILRSGTIYGNNQILFGNHSWQIKIFPPKHNDEETACISVGVSNKEQKKPIFVGTTLNYGYQKTTITIKVTLNCQQNKMIINVNGAQDEIYQNLPNFPIHPTLQNKGSNPVQIQCIFT